MLWLLRWSKNKTDCSRPSLKSSVVNGDERASGRVSVPVTPGPTGSVTDLHLRLHTNSCDTSSRGKNGFHENEADFFPPPRSNVWDNGRDEETGSWNVEGLVFTHRLLFLFSRATCGISIIHKDKSQETKHKSTFGYWQVRFGEGGRAAGRLRSGAGYWLKNRV